MSNREHRQHFHHDLNASLSASRQSQATQRVISDYFSSHGLNQNTATEIMLGHSVRGVNPAQAREIKRELTALGFSVPTAQA